MPDTNDRRAILAIDTSEIICGVCVYYSDDNFFSASTNLKHSHAEKIFDSIKWLLENAGIESGNLDSIAVSAGPGSFTGLRIGMSAAKGIAYGSGLPLVAVPTYEAFALQLSQILPDKSQFVIANKLNRDEVYFARFQIRGNSYIFADELAVLRNDEFRKSVSDAPVFGNAASLLERKVKFPLSPDPVFVAKWAVESGENKKTFEYDFLEPNYMKRFILKEKTK